MMKRRKIRRFILAVRQSKISNFFYVLQVHLFIHIILCIKMHPSVIIFFIERENCIVAKFPSLHSVASFWCMFWILSGHPKRWRFFSHNGIFKSSVSRAYLKLPRKKYCASSFDKIWLYDIDLRKMSIYPIPSLHHYMYLPCRGVLQKS